MRSFFHQYGAIAVIIALAVGFVVATWADGIGVRTRPISGANIETPH